MYSIVISIAVAIYSIILVDFSLLFKDIALNSDIIASTQAFYSAEGVIEKAQQLSAEPDAEKRLEAFLKAESDLLKNETIFNEYNKGATAGYFNLQLSTTEPDLLAAESFSNENTVTKSGVYLASSQALDDFAYYGLEPTHYKSFMVREVANEDSFNQISFDYNIRSENSDISFEVFSFPREGEDFNFKDFNALKNNVNSGPIDRVVINTKDPRMRSISFTPPSGQHYKVKVVSGVDGYQNRITISGFNPTGSNGRNYFFQFQTLDSQLIHYRLSAQKHSKSVRLANLMQTIDVIGSTTNGLYQRIKYQREVESSRLPGLNFVHFSNQNIHK